MTWTVWLLTATLALTLLPSNVVPTAVPLLRQEWGTSDAELGGVFTAYRLGYLAAVLLILPLTDRLAGQLRHRGLLGRGRAVVPAVPVPGLRSLERGSAPRRGRPRAWPASTCRACGSSRPRRPPERRGLMVSIYVSAYYFGAALSLWASGTLLPAFGWRGASWCWERSRRWRCPWP